MAKKRRLTSTPTLNSKLVGLKLLDGWQLSKKSFANYQSPGPREAQMDNGTSSNVFLTMLLSPMLPLEAKASEKKEEKTKKK